MKKLHILIKDCKVLLIACEQNALRNFMRMEVHVSARLGQYLSGQRQPRYIERNSRLTQRKVGRGRIRWRQEFDNRSYQTELRHTAK